MSARIVIIHYTPPGVIGGVETIIHEHVRLLVARGYEVNVVAGRPGPAGINVHVIPEIATTDHLNIAIEAELAGGQVTPDFRRAQQSIGHQLLPVLAEADVVIAHNAFTLHFCLPLTAVLWEVAGRRPPGSTIAWSHDLSWTNPLYVPSMHSSFPWDLLRTPAPHTRYVTVSAERRRELLDLWGTEDGEVTVVPNGIDAAEFLRLSPATREIVDRYGVFDRDVVLLLPVRITRRKNIELGIRAVHALRRRGLDALYFISGPVAPHHPDRSRRYLDELKALRDDLNLGEHVVFLADTLGQMLPGSTINELYTVVDALLLPSASEGFGLPVLEAGLARLPVALSDIPIFREVGGTHVTRFALDAAADTIAEEVLTMLDNPSSRLYRRVLREYRWDAIIDKHLAPLLPPSESHHAPVEIGQEG